MCFQVNTPKLTKELYRFTVPVRAPEEAFIPFTDKVFSHV